MNMINSVLEEIFLEFKNKENHGTLADYIPQLAQVKPDYFGIVMTTIDGHQYKFGDFDTEFTIQSISKAFVYGMALQQHGTQKVLNKISVEPSGDAFNSISLYPDSGRPYNPMINAGAIAATGLIHQVYGEDTSEEILNTLSRYAGSKLSVNQSIYQSESNTGHRNRAIAHLLRNFDILEDQVKEPVEAYFEQCSINVSCDKLSIMGATLANNGVNPMTKEVVLKSKYVPKVLSIMSSCGMYDYSGEWIYNIGLPAKSGVSGGVLAVLPGQLSFAVYSPLLDAKGNSVFGVEICQKIADTFSLHLYKTPRQSQQVIRKLLTLKTVRSKLKRATQADKIITENSDKFYLMELQGELSFASTEIFMRQIPPDLDTLILNLRKCSVIDEASISLLKRLKGSFKENGSNLYITNYLHLETLISHAEVEMNYFKFKAVEDALLHCENEILLSHHYRPITDSLPLTNQQLLKGLDDNEIAKLMKDVKFKKYNEGDIILKRGESASSIYFIESGKVYIIGTNDEGEGFLLAHLSAGSSFGEMALLENMSRSADVIAQNTVTCYLLNFSLLQSSDMANIRLKMITNLATTLSERLRVANREISGFM